MRLPVRFFKYGTVLIGATITLIAMASVLIAGPAGRQITVPNFALRPAAVDNWLAEPDSDTRQSAENRTPAASANKAMETNGDKAELGTAAIVPQTILDFALPSSAPVLRNIGNYYDTVLGCYRYHPGTDQQLAEGAVIRAVRAGKIVEAGEDPLLGNKIGLDCGDGWTVVYGGLANLRVKPGEKIEQNEAIGQIGLSAESDQGPALLHFEVWHNNEVQVPLRL